MFMIRRVVAAPAWFALAWGQIRNDIGVLRDDVERFRYDLLLMQIEQKKARIVGTLLSRGGLTSQIP